MNLSFFSFLAEPWFVIPWYVVGVGGAAWVIYDVVRVNRHVTPALKWAWPIIVFFFSAIGIALYVWTCRPPGIAQVHGEEEKKKHHEFVSTPFNKITGAVIHCVGGDGLGIMTAMVISRVLGMSFWQESGLNTPSASRSGGLFSNTRRCPRWPTRRCRRCGWAGARSFSR